MKRTHLSGHMLSVEVVAKNVDLLTLILLRVPAKSLVRFKCVSKHWLSVISESKFSNHHSHKNSIFSVSGLYTSSGPLFNFNTRSPSGLPKLNFLHDLIRVKPKILHSCNGLMLCSFDQEMIVCNLTTQKFTTPSCPPLDSTFEQFIAFYPTKSPHYKIILFGFNFPTPQLSRTDNSTGFSYAINIYSSRTGIRKNIRFIKPRINLFISGVLCDGAIYWTTSEINLVRFDIHEEKLENIQMSWEPEIEIGLDNIRYVGEYGGQLFLIHNRTPVTGEFQILELDMHTVRWNIKYNLNLDPVIDTFYATGEHPSMMVLCFMGGDEKISPILLLEICGKIISYNLMSKCVEILQDTSDDFDETTDSERITVHYFAENLALV